MALVSHRFHDVIIRILHNRLLHAASLEDHKLVLECYHPTSKLTTPYLFCEYLGTDGLSNEVEGEGSLYDDVKNCGRLGKLSSLYSHFKPIIPEENKVKRSHPAGSTPSTWYPGDSAPIVPTDSVPCCTMSLESHELFSQLVVITNMVKVGPKRGLFLSSVTIGEDVIRIWRKWLFDQVNDSASSVNASSSVFMAESFSANGRLDENKTGFLWVDKGKTVGLRFRVFEQKDVRNRPILLGIDEDPPVTCTLHYEGKKNSLAFLVETF